MAKKKKEKEVTTPERQPSWCYVNFCEHCGQFEIPRWGFDDGLTKWCSVCREADGEKAPEPPEHIEQRIKRIWTELSHVYKHAEKHDGSR